MQSWSVCLYFKRIW